MKKIFDNILAPLIVAALIANFTALWKMEQRLTRIETILQMKNIAQNL